MTIEQLLEEARQGLERATPSETVVALAEGALVIDVRCPDRRLATGMIPGSIAIGRSVLEWRCDPASGSRDDRVARPGDRVIVVCDQGYSSSLAAASLRRLGFQRVGDLIGGMEAWLEEGFPVERP